MRRFNLFIKRLMDLFGSLFGMILISPILIIIALSVKLTSRGPVLFRQVRLGKDGKLFKILKFRTMIVNAEAIGLGLFVCSEKDERITKVGRFLRATSLDELPQLWNVLIGQMSLVGARPPLADDPYTYEEYSEFQRKRFEMRPGMTGLTQITVRNSVTWEERIPIDVEYVISFQVWLDIKILCKTISMLFRRENIYEKQIEKEGRIDSHEHTIAELWDEK